MRGEKVRYVGIGGERRGWEGAGRRVRNGKGFRRGLGAKTKPFHQIDFDHKPTEACISYECMLLQICIEI